MIKFTLNKIRKLQKIMGFVEDFKSDLDVTVTDDSGNINSKYTIALQKLSELNREREKLISIIMEEN